MRPLTLIACLLVLVQVAACGSKSADDGKGSPGGDGDGDGALPSVCEVQLELNDGLTLGELTQDQANQACDAYGDLILCTFSESSMCRVEGIVAARSEGTDSPETCREVEAECLLSGSKTQHEWEEPCEDTSFPLGCPVTVAELRQCWNDLFAHTAEVQAERGQDSCDDVASYFDWAQTAQHEQYPPSCDGLLDCEEGQ